MAWDNSLPFERGVTWKDGNTASTAVPNVYLGGRVFPTGDNESVVNKTHGGSMVQELVALVNRASASVTLSRTGLRVCTLNTISPGSSFNGLVGSAADAARGGWIPDDHYTSGQVIAVGDVMYGVARGIVKARMTTRGGSIIVGDPLSFSTGGKLRKLGTSQCVIAVAMEACTTELVNKNVRVVDGFRIHS